ncbi:hypothetical protein Z517_09763 [Fonsecaea pedrosoi CBS 271.37]|uniref:Uncharacterized protein n=1 Tax=Fonsecaea pedrosoi CBS 271.37 TaxID=1442368 RepID=A0A0D2ESV0_9EURO|nr:uncharacterized protein Z517_09763 [Fonsecaea pedrosoi CBS 271.37]KIW77317.1 hypothetical protein Z517_09763 [Fonsecaea pedrosoi CBS 271.37]
MSKPIVPATWVRKSRRKLTRRALRRLDRRNEEAASSSSFPDHNSDNLSTPNPQAGSEDQQTTSSATHFLRHCRKAVLQDIKRFARGGGPDLTDLTQSSLSTAKPNRAMRKPRPSPTPYQQHHETCSTNPPTRSSIPTESAVTSGPYDRRFKQCLIDGGVYPPRFLDYRPEGPVLPANWETIRSRLSKSRPALSPDVFTDQHFLKFQEEDADATKENQVEAVFKQYVRTDDRHRTCSGRLNLKNLKPLSWELAIPASPDLYYGTIPNQLHARVRHELSREIVPTTQEDLPIVPNFFLEAKGPEGVPAVAKLQACFAGALGARGMHSLVSYGQGDIEGSNNAYTLTSTYCDGVLRMFTTHRSHSSTQGGPPEYYMNEIGAWIMNSDAEGFRRGATAYRNGRDWAEEQRTLAIKKANERAAKHGPVNEGPVDSAGSREEIAKNPDFAAVQSLGATFESVSTGNSHPLVGESSSNQVSHDHGAGAKRSHPDSADSPRPRKKQNTGL